MATQTAHVDMTAALGTGTGSPFGGAIRSLHLAAGLVANGAAGVARWLRAGQLGDGGSVDLGRWAGARR